MIKKGKSAIVTVAELKRDMQRVREISEETGQPVRVESRRGDTLARIVPEPL